MRTLSFVAITLWLVACGASSSTSATTPGEQDAYSYAFGALPLSGTSADVPSPPMPTVPIALAEGSTLWPVWVQAVVTAHYADYARCYAMVIADDASAAGRITIRFAVAANGSVTDAAIDGASFARPWPAAATECVLTTTRALTFPAATAATTNTIPFQCAR